MNSGPATTAPKRRKRPALECGHCGEVVSKSTYYRHRQRFYNPKTKKWKMCDEESKSSTGEECESYGFEDDSEITEWTEAELNVEHSEVISVATDRSMFMLV